MTTPSVAIVTGISRGFGRAVATELLEAGWHVVGNARDADALEQFERTVGRPDQLAALPGDVLEERHLENLVAAAGRAGSLGLVVNNAGGLGPSPMPHLAELEPDELGALFRVNVLAPLRLVQLALPVLTEGGAVVNVTSDASVEAYEGWGGYGATKAALDALTAVLAVERPHVRWYALDPGDMRTDMHQAAFPGEDITDRPPPEESAPAILKLLDGSLPSGRYSASSVLAG